tara:strand:- start:434 stop:727 length:294 start_codon:yes stop_codon:yes gene_type:complete
MKLKHIILFAILLIACTSNNIATDEQRSWCYAKALMIRDDDDLHRTFDDAHRLYRDEEGIEADFGKNNLNVPFRKNLAANDKEALRICKIWADINNE